MSKFLGDVLKLDSDNKIDILDNKHYRISGVQNYGQGIVIRREVSGKELTMKKYQVIKSNQLMWCKVDTKNGAFGLTKNEHVGSLASTNMALANIDTEQIIPDFLEMLFQNKHFHEHITKYSSGSTNRKYLTPRQLFDLIEIPDLTIDEQKKFLNKVNNLKNSGLSDEINTQQSLLKNLKQTILQEAIEGKLTAKWREQNPDIGTAKKLLEQIKTKKEKLIKDKKIKASKPLALINEDEIPFDIPQSWEWCRLGDIFQTTSGGTPDRGNLIYWNGDISWLKSGEMNDSKIIKESEEKITEMGLKNSSATLFPKNTVLIAMYGATAGKLGILTFPSTTNQAVCGFFENQFILKELLFYFLKSQREKILSDSWGQSQPNISQTYLKDIIFPLPPLEEQKEIVATIEKLFTLCDELECEINQNKTTVDNLMATVLKEAFEQQ